MSKKMSKKNFIRNMAILLGVAVSATSCSEETVDNNNNNNNTDQKGQYVIAASVTASGSIFTGWHTTKVMRGSQHHSSLTQTIILKRETENLP